MTYKSATCPVMVLGDDDDDDDDDGDDDDDDASNHMLESSQRPYGESILISMLQIRHVGSRLLNVAKLLQY